MDDDEVELVNDSGEESHDGDDSGEDSHAGDEWSDTDMEHIIIVERASDFESDDGGYEAEVDDVGIDLLNAVRDGQRNANGEEIVEDSQIIDLVNYDIGLPLEHSYLCGLGTVQAGRVIFSEGTKLKLPLVYLNGIILVPGQEIPFTFRHQSLVDFFRRIIENETKTFGIGYDNEYGTTAEIRSYNFNDNEVTLRAEGRQRFVITSKQLEMYEIYNAYVVILPEIDLKNYFRTIRATEHVSSYSSKELLAITPFPGFVHRQYNDQTLMDQIRVDLKPIIESNSLSQQEQQFTYPVDPTAFSYFVITCIPLSDRMKSKLLQFNCTTERLRVEHALLSIPFDVRCAHCSTKLCSKEDFLVMSKMGTGGTFVNPSGVVHELFTFSKVENIAPVSQWDDRFSWFPNYGWIIIRCRRCLLHLGWKFVTKENIRPKSFFAITRTAIKLSFDEIGRDSFIYKFVHENGQNDNPILINWNTGWNPLL